MSSINRDCHQQGRKEELQVGIDTSFKYSLIFPSRLTIAVAAASLFVVSNSVRLHRWQPTRLPRPWDSPGKNTGVGCHFLLQCTKVKSESEVSQSYPTLSDPMDCSLPGSSVHGIFQARVLDWVAIAFSKNHHYLFPIPWGCIFRIF